MTANKVPARTYNMSNAKGCIELIISEDGTKATMYAEDAAGIPVVWKSVFGSKLTKRKVHKQLKEVMR